MVFCSPQQPKPFTPHFSSQKRSALRRPMQRAAMRDAPHYVFCLNLAHDSPPRALALHSTLSAPSQSRPYSYQKCGRRDEGQAWHKNPYPLGQTCIRARFPIEAFCGHVFRAKVPGPKNTLGGLTGRFRGVLGPSYGLPHCSLQRTEAGIAVIVPVHHAAQMMLAGETALVTQRPGIVIATTTPPCFCSRCDWHAEMKQSSMRTARTVIFLQVFGIAFLPSCSKVQAGRRER